MMGKVMGSVVELFGTAAANLNTAVIVIGLSLKAQVEMMEVLVGVLAEINIEEVSVRHEKRAAEIVAGLSEGCRSMYSLKKEN